MVSLHLHTHTTHNHHYPIIHSAVFWKLNGSKYVFPVYTDRKHTLNRVNMFVYILDQSDTSSSWNFASFFSLPPLAKKQPVVAYLHCSGHAQTPVHRTLLVLLPKNRNTSHPGIAWSRFDKPDQSSASTSQHPSA